MRFEVEKMKKMNRRSLLALLTAALLLLGLSGCGGSSNSAATPSAAAESGAYITSSKSADWAGGAAAPSAMEEPMGEYWDGATEESAGTAGDESRSTLPDGVKMIYRADLELETTEFEQAAGQVKALTAQLGGYFEEQNSYTRSGGYRSASYTIRVPAERFEDFLGQIGSVCTVVRQTQSAEDVSEYYYDMESRLETAKIKLDRLQDLLSRAEEMEDIITLEGAISDTEYQIERLSGEKRHYDALIGYSTIDVSLSEVYRITEVETAPLTFGQRVGIAFRDGLRNFTETVEDFIEWLAYSWLSLLVLALIVVIVVKLVKSGRAKRAVGAPHEKRAWFRKKDKNAPSDKTDETND